MTNTTLIAIFQFTLGLTFLILLADRFICSCIHISEKFNIPRAVIGLTIVAIGTSLPELVLTIVAVSKGEPDIAIGNVIGSNISNIGLVFALSILINKQIVRPLKSMMDLYSLVITTLAVAIIMYVQGTLTYIHSIILYAMAIFSTYILWAKNTHDGINLDNSTQTASLDKSSDIKQYVQLVVCAILIPLSADQLLNGGITIAHIFNINPLIIGLLFMAIGTSLPELATSISAAMRNERDIVIGNIIGSNIFNITLVLGSASILEDITVAPEIRNFDVFIMLALTSVFAGIYLIKKPELRYVFFVIIMCPYTYFIYHSLTLPRP